MDSKPYAPGHHSSATYLQTRINLLNHIVTAVFSPIATSLSHDRRDSFLLDELRLLHHIDVQTTADMPGNVAVERPYTRVIRVVLDDKVAIRLYHLNIATLGVENVFDTAIPCSGTFRQDVKIVAVKMHGMCGSGFVVQDDPDAVVGTEVVDVPLWVIRVGSVSEVGEQEYRMIIVASE